MKILSSPRFLLAVVLPAFAVCVAPTGAAEKYTLKHALEPGGMWTFDNVTAATNVDKLTRDGVTKTTGTVKCEQHVTGKTQVLAVKDRVPVSFRISYGNDCDQTAEMVNTREKHPLWFAGKTITMTRGDDGRVTDDFTGEIDPAAREAFHGGLSLGAVAQLLPKEPVAVGDTWRGVTGPEDHGEATLKLLSVKEFGGRQVAEVKLNNDATWQAGGMTFTQKYATILLIDARFGLISGRQTKTSTSRIGEMMHKDPDGTSAVSHVEGSGTSDSTYVLHFIPAGPAPARDAGNPLAPAAPMPNEAGNPLAQAAPTPNDAGNPLAQAATFAGRFSDSTLKVEISSAAGAYRGVITLGDRTFPVKALDRENVLEGSFEVDSKPFPFTAILTGDILKLVSGSRTYLLKRESPTPLSPAAP